MVMVLLRAGVIAGALYGIGAGIKKVAPGEEHVVDPDHAKQSFSGLVFKKLLRTFAWMLYVIAFYTVVPMWRDFVWYVVSLALTGFVTFYVLGYPEDNKPDYRKLLFRLALIAFMGVVMVSTGLVRYLSESSEAAWQKLPSVMVFSTAVVLALAAFLLAISAAMAHDPTKDALKVAYKVSLGASIAMFALVFLFGDMTWLQFRKGYSEVKAAPRTADWVGDRYDDAAEALSSDDPAPTPETALPYGEPYNEPVPAAPPEPDRPSKRSKSDDMADAPDHTIRKPVPVVRETPHEGDELDAVTDGLDRMANRRASVGL
jgi:hypothetical protein